MHYSKLCRSSDDDLASSSLCLAAALARNMHCITQISSNIAGRNAAACDLSTVRPRHLAARPRTWQKCTCKWSSERSLIAKLPAMLLDKATEARRRASVGLAACMLTGTLLNSPALALPSDSQSIQSGVLVVSSSTLLWCTISFSSIL